MGGSKPVKENHAISSKSAKSGSARAASSRRRHTNSKLGCLNCKRKKIRCDENLPECNNCTKGKEGQCSYLLLSNKEINKIILTHLLRNSQNKLLSTNYKLPTSSFKIEPDSESLEFKHELSKLPIRIPSFLYPPLQYKIVKLEDFEADFKVMESEENDQSSVLASLPISTTPTPFMASSKPILPNGVVCNLKIPRINHKITVHPQMKLNEYQFTKLVNLDHILPLLHRQSSKHVHVLNDMIICLGQVIVVNELRKRFGHHPGVKQLVKRCLETHSTQLSNVKLMLSEFYTRSKWRHTASNDQLIEDLTPILFYATKFLSYCLLLLDFSLENYTRINEEPMEILGTYLRYNDGTRPIPVVIRLLMNIYQYLLLTIKIPPYDPQCLLEITSNLESLRPVFNAAAPHFGKIKAQFDQLVDFIHGPLTSVLNSRAQGERAVNYPIAQVYSLLKQWIAMYPSESFVPGQFNEGVPLLVVTKDLSSTIFSYYYLIGSLMRGIFSFTPYLFDLSFPTLENNVARSFYEVSPEIDHMFPQLGIHNLHEFLQRHNYYSLRIYSFLKHRTRIVMRNIHWESEKIEDVTTSRVFKNVSETPIKSFTYTLIRPEHYPTSTHKDTTQGSTFTREDETMRLKLYTRNIETLDFFDYSRVLQFDYQSMAILRDYRPSSSRCFTNFDPMTAKDFDDYTSDRTSLIKLFKLP